MRKGFFLITNKCNSNCKYCFYNTGHEKRQNIEFDAGKIDLLLNRLKELDFSHIIITGGEPLATKETTQKSLNFVKSALNKGFKVNFSTNGIGITKTLAKELFKLEISIIFVSLDSHVKETHNSQRQGYSKTLKGIKNLISTGIRNITINVVITKYNYTQIEQIYNFLKNLGVPAIIFQPAFLPKTSQLYEELSVMTLSLKEREKIADEIKKYTENKNYARLVKAFLLEKNTCLNQSCRMGKTFFLIHPNCDLYTCFHTEQRLGNLIRDSKISLADKINSFENKDIPSCFGFHCLSLYSINSFWRNS